MIACLDWLGASMSNEPGWFRISNTLIDNGHLANMSANAAKVLMCLARHAGDYGISFPKQDTIMRETGIAHIATLRRAISELTKGESQCVEIVQRGCGRGRATEYRIRLDTTKKGTENVPLSDDKGVQEIEAIRCEKGYKNYQKKGTKVVPPRKTHEEDPVRTPPIPPQSPEERENRKLIAEAEAKRGKQMLTTQDEVYDFIGKVIPELTADGEPWKQLHLEIAERFWDYERLNRRKSQVAANDVKDWLKRVIKGHGNPRLIGLGMMIYVNDQTSGGAQIVGSQNPNTGIIGKRIRPTIETRDGPQLDEWFKSEYEKMTGVSLDGVSRKDWRYGRSTGNRQRREQKPLPTGDELTESALSSGMRMSPDVRAAVEQHRQGRAGGPANAPAHDEGQ